jgi:hypothetical protein
VKVTKIRPSFVEFIPDVLEEGVLYISERYKTCSHKCCCGCGEEVVTPLSPAEWRLTQEGDTVSLWPSVGNWDYACRSHYFIERDRVTWAAPMSTRQVANAQRRDAADLERMVSLRNAAKDAADSHKQNETSRPLSWWQRLLRWLCGGGA